MHSSKKPILLSEIATCTNGFTFREKPIHVPNGQVRVIQMGDISTTGQLNLEVSLFTSIEAPNQKFILQTDDLLFRGRGTLCASTLMPKNKKETIAASPLIFIRPDKKQVLPSYLNWIINSALSQSYFQKLAQGSIIKSIGIRELLQLPVPLPSLAKQKQIVAISNCFHKERALLTKLNEKKETLLTSFLLKNNSLTKRTLA